MTRSTEFSSTVSRGLRSAQPDMVLHYSRDDDDPTGPRIGLVVAKTVGNAVVRHRVARRLRHVARTVLGDLDGCDRVVIRARPGADAAVSAGLERQLRDGLERIQRRVGSSR
jgi:ribonuclease P protein component